jgi:hypothetical protein
VLSLGTQRIGGCQTTGRVAGPTGVDASGAIEHELGFAAIVSHPEQRQRADHLRRDADDQLAMQRVLTTGLTDETKNSLDALLKIAPEMTTTRLTWLRNASQSPAPTNILGLIERVEFLRKLGIDRERQQAIPASAFDPWRARP